MLSHVSLRIIFTITIITMMFVLIVGAYGQLYERIPKYQVGAFMQQYLGNRELNDCFYTIISDNVNESGREEMVLKCLRDGELVTLYMYIFSPNNETTTVSASKGAKENT